MNFKNRCALITGAAVGIGRACAFEFAEAGASLALYDIDESGLEKLKGELAVYGVEVHTARVDVSCEREVNAAFKESEQMLGKLDILVNNAGIWRTSKPFWEIDPAEWQRYININVMGTVYVTRAALPGMLDRGFGRIINVASVAGTYGNARMTQYSATKGALIAMTRALAKEVADKGITVNAVSPGTVSPSEQGDINYTQPSTMQYAGRNGSGAENAALIAFLASDEAAYISGQNILIDGCRKNI